MSITHNKNLNLLLNCISAKSAPRTFSIKGECTFPLLKFLITGLCNSSASSLLEAISFLVADLFASVKAQPEKFFIEKIIDH